MTAEVVVEDGVDSAVCRECWGLDEQQMWFHVSHQSKTPFVTMLQAMEEASEEEACAANVGAYEVCLKAKTHRSEIGG